MLHNLTPHVATAAQQDTLRRARHRHADPRHRHRSQARAHAARALAVTAKRLDHQTARRATA